MASASMPAAWSCSSGVAEAGMFRTARRAVRGPAAVGEHLGDRVAQAAFGVVVLRGEDAAGLAGGVVE